MRFAITGSTGLLGNRLTRELRALGHAVTRVVRSYSDVPHGERAVVWHPAEGVIEQHGLEAHDVVVHFAGESLFGVWTERRKRRILESRVRGTSLIATTVGQLQQRPRVLFTASGVHFYGDRGPAILDESSAPGTGFLADVVRQWEAAAAPATAAGVRVVNMRFGVVLSASGGILEVMRPLFRLGLGGRIGNGKQYWSWISIDDITPAILHVLEHEDLAGPINFAAPEPVTNDEFTRTLAAVAQRPAVVNVPAFAARLAPGGMGNELMLSSTRAVPRRLLDSGYTFRQPTLRSALEAQVQ